MSSRSRRAFLKTSSAFAAGFTIAGTKASGRVLGANETIRAGVAYKFGGGYFGADALGPCEKDHLRGEFHGMRLTEPGRHVRGLVPAQPRTPGRPGGGHPRAAAVNRPLAGAGQGQTDQRPRQDD